MVSISMIDIVTVVFQDELDVLKLQAQSIDLYCHDMNLGQIYVVINDDSVGVDSIDTAWWGTLSNRVKVLHRQNWNVDYLDNGWLTQQLLKLLTAAHSTNDWSMILDAKTIFVQQVKLDRIFDKDGRVVWGYLPVFPVFEPARKKVSELFNINQTHVIGPAGVPFLFYNSTVRDMIKEVESRTSKQFSNWFQEAGVVTEFILYSGYVQFCDGTLEHRYVNGFLNVYNLCNVCHNEVDQFDSKYLEMQHDSVLTVSIHRGAWNKLSDLQKNNYQKLLSDAGIKI